MGPLEQAKSELIRQFETLVTTDQQSAIARLQTKMKLGVDLLAWMKGQLVYPQFYLRFRDEDKTVAAVGKVRSFSDVNLAQQFIQEHDFPLVGGLQFQGESQFILPQVLIEQHDFHNILDELLHLLLPVSYRKHLYNHQKLHVYFYPFQKLVFL